MAIGIEQALADMASAASSPEILGRSHQLNGAPVVCIVRALTVEEASAFAGGRYEGDGLTVVGCRVTVDVELLASRPVVDGVVNVDGDQYTVRVVDTIGTMLRLTLTRYAA